MTENKPSNEFDQLILREYPYPVAVNYKQLLEEEDCEKRTRKCLEVFEFTLRTFTLGILSQYLMRDVHQVSDPILDRLLYRQLNRATLGTWVEFFFLTLRAYQGKRNLFFMPELYDFYWDTSLEPHRKRKGLREPFIRLVQIRNDLAHRFGPNDDQGWDELCDETLNLLRTILASFEFIKNYDLIRVTDHQHNEYSYDRYTGQNITSHEEPFQTEEELRTGWFYLSRQDRKVLNLHPLLIFWSEEGETEPLDTPDQDVAIYDNLLKEAVQYMATVVREIIAERDADIVAMFRDLIYHNLEHIKLARKRTLLSWDGLRLAAVELTQKQMETAFSKYQPALYLQRQVTFNSFLDFLSSDKGCFVLTGKSGVGKTNFLLSLTDEFAQREDLALIIYNGARFDALNPTIQQVSQDLADYLTVEGPAPDNLFEELDRRQILKGKTLILAFDAINENQDGKALLEKIDQMVAQTRYPWLKVVITSRPQAWQTLKSGLPLAEARYFFELDQDIQLSKEQELSFSLEPFQSHELHLVYEKYRQAFQIQTDFDSISPAIRRELSDPLMLRLITEIYRNQAIPDQGAISDIYQQYILALVNSGRLDDRDIHFLKAEIVPLMISPDRYANSVTASQIQSASTNDQRSLWELVFNTDLLSNNEPINRSFARLVDAEILSLQGSALDYSITFKYERFYEFFCGEALYRIYQTAHNPLHFIQQRINDATQEPFLLGVIQNALLYHLRNGGDTDDICSLSRSEIPLERDIAKSVLTRFGEETDTHLELIENILNHLLPEENLDKELTDKEIFGGLVATRVSGDLKLASFLVRAAKSKSTELRAEFFRSTYLLWVQDQTIGWQILDQLIDENVSNLRLSQLIWQAIRKDLHFESLESAGWLSFFILVNHHAEEGVARQLQTKWKPIIERIIFYQEDSSFLKSAFLGVIRGMIISAIIDIVIARIRTFSASRYHVVNIHELLEYYKLPRNVKEEAYSLAEYLDPNYGDLEELREKILDLYPTQNGLINQIIGHVLVAQAQTKLRNTLELIQEIYYLGVNSSEPGILSGNMLWVCTTLAKTQDEIDDHLFDTLQKMIFDGVNKVKEWHSPLRTYPNIWYEDYARIYIRKNKSYNVDLIDDQIEKAMRENDLTTLQDLMYGVGQLSKSPYWRTVLEVAKTVMPSDSPEIKAILIDLLVRVRTKHKDQVDHFLYEYCPDTEMQQQVMVKEIEESIFDMIGGGAGPFVSFIIDTLHTDLFRQDLIWLFQRAAISKNANQAMKAIAKWIINTIYGEAIFDLGTEYEQRHTE